VSVNEIVLSRRPDFLTEIAASDLDIAILGQLAAAQLALDDKLEPGALEMERFQAPLGRRRLIEEMLEDAPADPHGALVLAEQYAEFDGRAVRVPARIFGEAEKDHCDLQGNEGIMFL
jgi:hypothetical protein